ncbi:MAG: excinuclease ABC subunit UvrC [bacterium]|nr:excinuclease ABC subunit UvrC [bacterium]
MSSESKQDNEQNQLKEKLALLPSAPGVYLHKNKQGKVIYVGKAKHLTQRVRSYFHTSGDKDAKTELLVKNIDDFDYIVTDTDADALVLENQLIKEYRPLYNVRLKDDKAYPYLRISLNEPFPRITVVRHVEEDGAKYFGPYTNVHAMRKTLNFAAAAFQIRTCHLDLPEQTVPRACLDYQIGRCSAPCVDYDTLEGYGQKVKRLVKFMEGGDSEVVAELQSEMESLSLDLKFEDAAKIRDLITQLENTTQNARPVSGVQGNCDLCAVAREGGDASGVILRVRGGKILTSLHFMLADKLESGLDVFMSQLLREYYERAGEIPHEIYLSHEVADLESWGSWLSKMREKPVKLKVPQRGIKKEAVQLAHTNATFKLREVLLKKELHNSKYRSQVTPADIELQEALDLHTTPKTIECFDISNFQGKETVASLVFFKDGKPLKSRYRRFKVKTVEGPDDFASMTEVLGRYYGKLLEKNQPAADLVMVDGGAGQLSRAREVLGGYGLHETQLIGLAKREETIHGENGTLNLPHSSEALKLLQRVRDEAHRFAITYHRLLRDQKTTASELDLIPGIGKMKKLALLHHFSSVAQIRLADSDDLAQVRGINRHDAVAILEYFDKARRED